MASTVLVKAACWAWCRLIRNSSVQALAQDAITDCVFNTFSIIFPLIGFYARIWWLDPLVSHLVFRSFRCSVSLVLSKTRTKQGERADMDYRAA